MKNSKMHIQQQHILSDIILEIKLELEDNVEHDMIGN